jgi:hypothetical protein
MAQMTNEEFGDRVGCHYSMASRLRWGQRMPGRELFGRIVREFDLDPAEALEALDGGPVVFSNYLRKNVFEPSGEGSPVTSPDGS